MTKCNHEAFSFSNCRKRQVRMNFSGGSISSNGGALLLRELDRQMGLTARVARAVGDQRQRGKVVHKVDTGIFLFCKTWWCRLEERFLPARFLYAGKIAGASGGLVRAGSVFWCRARRRGRGSDVPGPSRVAAREDWGEAVKS